MRNILFSALLLFTSTYIPAQNNKTQKPFTLHGQITHFSKDQMILFFLDKAKGYRDYTIDTIKINKDGSFNLQSYKAKTPTIATLRSDNLSVDFYIAPGYDLTFKADATDLNSFHLKKSISGKGQAANKYLFALDSVTIAGRDSAAWYEMDEPHLLEFVKKNNHTRDSLYNVYFTKLPAPDEWYTYFAKTTSLDNKFMKLYYLLSHATDNRGFDYAKAVSFVENNSDKAILSNLFKEEYMTSSVYNSWLTYIYTYYLKKLDCLKDSTYCNEQRAEVQLVEQIADHYKGSVKELKLFNKLRSSITFCRSFEELNLYKREFPLYIAQLKSKTDQQEINELFSKMDTTLLQTQIGNAAPAFTAEDSTGKKYSLEDYKGKVVYIDLWASWCAPCRYETPFLQKLTEKYKHDQNMIFISIAVMDKYDKWKEALKSDNPTWIQLFDTNATVQNAYVANSIPKFIVVNKEGKIVSFDASSPSSGEVIEKLLNEELTK